LGSLDVDVVAEGCGNLVPPEEADMLVVGRGASVLDFDGTSLASSLRRS